MEKCIFIESSDKSSVTEVRLHLNRCLLDMQFAARDDQPQLQLVNTQFMTQRISNLPWMLIEVFDWRSWIFVESTIVFDA